MAVLEVIAGMTVDEVATVIGEPRATVGRWVKELREAGDLGRWPALAVERLAAYEAKQLGTASISDSLRPDADDDSLEDPNAVRSQINRAQRKNSSLMMELDEIAARGAIDRTKARVLLEKTDAALKETAGQQSTLARWRHSLLRRLKGGG